jgi:hypothetical protein
MEDRTQALSREKRSLVLAPYFAHGKITSSKHASLFVPDSVPVPVSGVHGFGWKNDGERGTAHMSPISFASLDS